MEWTVTDFTPEWRTAGENDQTDIGNGTLAGVVDDETGEITITLEIAENTNMGQGHWIFRIPDGVANLMFMNPNGKAETTGPDLQQYMALAPLDRFRGFLVCQGAIDSNAWGATVPYAWEVGSRLKIVYRHRNAATPLW
jgi:hypothetical protein